MQKFPQLPERFIEWALEAANFEKEKAERLLQEVGPQTPDEFKPFVLTGEAIGTRGKTNNGEGKKSEKIKVYNVVTQKLSLCFFSLSAVSIVVFTLILNNLISSVRFLPQFLLPTR